MKSDPSIPQAPVRVNRKSKPAIILDLTDDGRLRLLQVANSDEECRAIMLALQKSIICGDFAELAGL